MLPEHYDAARNHAAVVRQDWMGLLKLSGPERQSWLQGMVTNEVEKLAPGQGCYAGHLNAQGRLVAQMIVLITEEDVWLLVERSATAKLAAVFDKLIIMEDVQVRDTSDEYAVLGLIGPKAAEVLKTWSGTTLPNTPLYRHLSTSYGRIISTDLGFTVIVPREDADRYLRELTAAGAVEVDQDTWNIVRTEAGLPQYGIDIDETTTLPEVGPRGISYDKGCYIGQEVVARIKYIGHVNRCFVGVICEGLVIPDIRSTVQMNGKDVGYVTTGVLSPGLGKPVALGFVNRASAEPGTAVVVAGKRGPISAVIASLPLLPIRYED